MVTGTIYAQGNKAMEKVVDIEFLLPQSYDTYYTCIFTR